MFAHGTELQVIAGRSPGREVPTIRVRAVRRGYIYDITRDVGDEFACALKDLALVGDSPAGYETGWMVPASEQDHAALRNLTAFKSKHALDHAQALVDEAARAILECEAALSAARLKHARAIAELITAGGSP